MIEQQKRPGKPGLLSFYEKVGVDRMLSHTDNRTACSIIRWV